MSTGTMTQEITRSEADLIVRHVVGAAYDKEGYKWLDADSLARKLSYYIDADVDADYVVDFIGHLRDLEQIEDGTSEELQVNRACTIDNRTYLTAYYEGEINCTVNQMLDTAGIRGDWLLRHSVTF